jgi:hypothetical protein
MATPSQLDLRRQNMSDATNQLPVIVIGAGPAGLSAAAHLLERVIPTRVLEAGERVGTSLLDFGHVRLFSPWQYNIDPVIAKRLARDGWQHPNPDELPLAREIVERVLEPFASLPDVRPMIALRHRVVAVTREGFDKVKTEGRERAAFVLRVATPQGEEDWLAGAVIDASGTWSTANPLGANGLPAIGEEEARSRIHYGIPDILGRARSRYEGKRVLVVGSGHSAANSLLALSQLAAVDTGTQLLWAIRGRNPARAFGGGEADALPARGRLGSELHALQKNGRLELLTDFRISALSLRDGRVTVHALGADGTKKQVDAVDEVIGATGQRPDLEITAELRLRHDPWLESSEALGPLIDPNVHSCGTVRPHGHRELSHPEPGFYAIGSKSYGRAPNFLMTTGHEQARSVAAAIAGDLESADRVELVLPETGVCGTDAEDTGCCGGPESQLLTIEEPATAVVAAASGTTSSGSVPKPSTAKGCCT